MDETEHRELKRWYMAEVRACLAGRGMTGEQADDLIRSYKLQERLDAFPDVQMHYAIEVTADEIVMEMTRMGNGCTG